MGGKVLGNVVGGIVGHLGEEERGETNEMQRGKVLGKVVGGIVGHLGEEERGETNEMRRGFRGGRSVDSGYGSGGENRGDTNISEKDFEDNPKRCKEAGSQQAKSFAMSSAESLTMSGEERAKRSDVIIIIIITISTISTISTAKTITPRILVHRIVRQFTSSMVVEEKRSDNTHTL